MSSPNNPLKIAYIHARPHGHPIHEAYANSLEPDRFPIDFILRWHDRQRPALVRYSSWVLCALFFPKRKKYDVFYADGPVHFLAIMKFLGLITKRQKVIYLMADETLYFIENKYYGKIADRALRWVLTQADGFICVGDQQEQLLKKVLTKRNLKYRTIVNGIDNNTYQTLSLIEPNMASKNMVCIANVGDSDVRMLYKGLDFLPIICSQIKSENLKVVVIGEVSERIRQMILKQMPQHVEIVFIGHTNELVIYLKDAFLCIHPSRGEAWGISILECMRAGIPTVVSTRTGSKQIVSRLGNSWIQEIDDFATVIDQFYLTSLEYKYQISGQARASVEDLTLKNSCALFKDAFRDLIKSFNLDSDI